MSSEPQPVLDHIVILVPQETLLNLPPWITQAFTVLTGGRHADGVTENKLILFQDGVYLELISFVPGKEKERDSHKWGHRAEGHIIDWANTLHDEKDLSVIKDRIQAVKSGIVYSDLIEGGRIRPDGTELKWAISHPIIKGGPISHFKGGEAPFWCLDRTPRDLRVPYQVKDNVRHPCGASGVQAVTVCVKDEALFQVLRQTFNALQGQSGEPTEVKKVGNGYSWQLQVLQSLGRSTQRRLSLVLVDSEDALKGVPDVFVKIGLFTSSKAGKITGNLGDDDWVFEIELIN